MCCLLSGSCPACSDGRICHSFSPGFVERGLLVRVSRERSFLALVRSSTSIVCADRTGVLDTDDRRPGRHRAHLARPDDRGPLCFLPPCLFFLVLVVAVWFWLAISVLGSCCDLLCNLLRSRWFAVPSAHHSSYAMLAVLSSPSQHRRSRRSACASAGPTRPAPTCSPSPVCDCSLVCCFKDGDSATCHVCRCAVLLRLLLLLLFGLLRP